MKQLVVLLLLVLVFNCSNSNEDKIKSLNGYWEIEKVVLADGTERNYSINLTIDYISINDSLKGFRKKMQPTLEGNYITSKDFENINLKEKSGNLIIEYKTEFSTWSETILKANDKELHLKNNTETTYFYKRYEPLNLDHGKTKE